MSDDRPPTLAYAGPRPRRPSAAAFVGGTALLGLAFIVAFNVIERWTNGYVAEHGGVGPFHLRPELQWHFERYGDRDLIREFAWSLPATFLFVCATALVRPQRGWRLRASVLAFVPLAALACSWVRWAMSFAHVEVEGSTDFLIAMSLAVAAGVGTGLLRRWLPTPVA